MKPVAQGCTAMAQDGKCAPVVWFGAYPKDGENVYTESEIRKWLEEDPSEAMIALGVNVPSPPYFIDSFKEREELIVTSIYKTLITVKLEELK